MHHDAAFHLGLNCLQKYPFSGLQQTKGKALLPAVWFAVILSKKDGARPFCSIWTSLIRLQAFCQHAKIIFCVSKNMQVFNISIVARRLK